MNGSRALVKVPASTANLGPGFDALGMALNLYAWIEMSPAEHTRIELVGSNLDGIPTDKSNLIYKVARQVFEEAGRDCPELSIKMYSEIPLTRGLGSSASAIVGGMASANALLGGPLSREKLLQMATRLENHPDNVGASIYGGFVAASWDGSRAELVRIDPHPMLEVLVAIPEFHLSTEKARHALPSQVSMRDAVFNVSRSSLLVAALCSGKLDKIAYAMQDALHQPYRAPMIPGMSRILAEAADHGALGAALSGAGPTLLALVRSDSSRKTELETFLLGALAEEGVKAETMWLKPCPEGVRVLTPADENSTFIENMANIKGEVRA